MIIKLKKFFVIALALMSVITLSILPALAVTVPDYDINDDNYNYYIIFKYDNGVEAVILSTDKLFVTDESDYIALRNKNGNVKTINFTTNISTLMTSAGIVGSISSEAIYSSNYDIYYADTNEVFFQSAPLLNKLLEQVPQGVGEKITTDLATLTICGVGCLALLICLALLPKVLYKFL